MAEERPGLPGTVVQVAHCVTQAAQLAPRSCESHTGMVSQQMAVTSLRKDISGTATSRRLKPWKEGGSCQDDTKCGTLTSRQLQPLHVQLQPTAPTMIEGKAMNSHALGTQTGM